MAFQRGENQTQRRNEYASRQNRARSDFFDTNRQISEFEFAPIPNNTVATSTQTLTSTTKSSTITNTTASTTGYRFVTNSSSQPSTALLNASTAGLTASSQNHDRIEDLHAKLDHLIKKSNEADQMKVTISSNSERLNRIEAKIGQPDEIAVPLSLAIRNLPLPGYGEDDLQIVKALLFEINAKDVNPEQDIVKVVRKGATGENSGTVMVELISDDVRASIMKTKKILENHENPCLRRVIIKNMKSQQELKMDIAVNEILRKLPGGENLYIANNGHIREKTPQQMAYKNSLQNRIPSRPEPGFMRNHHQGEAPSYSAQDSLFGNTNPGQSFRPTYSQNPGLSFQPTFPQNPLVRGPYPAQYHVPDTAYRHTIPGPNFRHGYQQQPMVPMPVPHLSIPGQTQLVSSSPLLVGPNQLISSQPSERSQAVHTELPAQTVILPPPPSSLSVQADSVSVSQPEPQQRQLSVVTEPQSQEQPHHQVEQGEVIEDISDL